VTVIDDVRTLDPVSYIRQLDLRPEDSYGFLPMRIREGTAVLYLYRDRPDYAEARSKLAPPAEPKRLGPIEVHPSQSLEIEMEAPGEGPGIDFGDIIAEAQKQQQTYCGIGSAPPGASGDPPTPDSERLARIEKLRASGAIDDAEHAKLRAEGGPPIVAHRIYPGLGWRSSGRQLNRFLPRYQETVGVNPEDVYGVFPWSQMSSGGEGDTMEWKDYWIVYRDRPEYALGREAYAAEMDKKGRWPQPLFSPGVGEAEVPRAVPGKLKVEKDRWPRKAVVVKQKDAELADSLREKISKWGFEPEDSYGFCPNFPHSSIYFGWRKS
jgi:hypothetical protein